MCFLAKEMLSQCLLDPEPSSHLCCSQLSLPADGGYWKQPVLCHQVRRRGGGQIDLCCELGMMVVHKVFLTVIHFRVKIDCKIPSNEIMKIQQH